MVIIRLRSDIDHTIPHPFTLMGEPMCVSLLSRQTDAKECENALPLYRKIPVLRCREA